jgi:hypothetical protein
VKLHSVQIAPGAPVAGKTRISVDGQDISTAVTRAVLELDVKNAFPELHLELGHVDVTEFGAEETRVVLIAPTRDALIALGWTPPPEDT